MASSSFPFLLSVSPPPRLHLSRHLPTYSPANPSPRFQPRIAQKPLLLHKSIRAIQAPAGLSSSPLVSPLDQWGIWTTLFTISTFSIWSESTKVGSTLSAAIVSTLVGLAASNLGIIPTEAQTYTIVMEYLLPLSIPLLLFRADLRRIVRSTGTLLLVFLLGSAATVIGTTIAYLVVPMRSLGQDSWKIAAALMGSYIGGTVNYVAISEALGTSPSVVAAGLAADNVICAIYFTLLFALASKIPPETSTFSTDDQMVMEPKPSNKLPLLETATALAISFAICKTAIYLAKLVGFQGGSLQCMTALIVILATAFPAPFAYLAPAGESIALILMQVFFATVGASGSIWNVIMMAPGIFAFALVQVGIHLAVVLGVGKLLGLDKKLLLLASNANVGGPTTACAMATAKGWSSLAAPSVLAGLFGITIATFLGIGFGSFVLRIM